MPAKARPSASYPYISRVDAARFLCVSVQQIDKWRLAETLHAFRVGRKIIFRLDEVALLVETGGLPVMPRPRPKGKVRP